MSTTIEMLREEISSKANHAVIAAIVLFLASSKGRFLLSTAVGKGLRKGIYNVPVSARYKLISFFLARPLSVARAFYNEATKPVGYEYLHFGSFKRQDFAGSWIVAEDIARKKDAIQWVENTTSAEADLVILFIHGGGFRIGYATQYLRSFLHIIEHVKNKHGLTARILSVEYTLTPEARYPTAQKECVRSYEYLVNELGIDPSKIIVAGDSAGGWLTAQTVLTMRDEQQQQEEEEGRRRLPAGSVMISPWITLELTSPTLKTHESTDVVRVSQLEAHIKDYLPQLTGMSKEEQAAFLQQPEISPVYANYKDVGKVLVTYGEGEILKYDIKRLVDKLKTTEGVQLDVIARENAPHIWVVEPSLCPSEQAWRDDLSLIADWCANTVKQD